MAIVVIATINNEFRLPSVPTVGKKCHSVSLMGPTSWYWQNLHPVNFWCSLFPAPIHTLPITATFASLSHFILHHDLEEAEMLGGHCHLNPCSPPISLGKLTKLRSLQKQRP